MSPSIAAGSSQSIEETPFSREEYLELRKSFVAAEHAAVNSLDQGLLTLSGSLLALSITFVEQLAAKPPRFIWLLGIAWLFLLVSLLAALLSFHWSHAAWRQQIEILDQYQNGQISEQAAKNAASETTRKSNLVSITCFIVGTVLLAIFVVFNLPYR